jgi:hypothetical protein
MGKRNTAPDLIDHTVHRVQVDTAWHSEEWANSCQTSPLCGGGAPKGRRGTRQRHKHPTCSTWTRGTVLRAWDDPEVVMSMHLCVVPCL